MLFSLSINKTSYADIVRPTTFDERPACEKSAGTWRDYGNICADKCEPKFEKYPICTNGIIFSCDCGKNRCLHEDKCIGIEEYQKIFEEKSNLELKEQLAYKKKESKIVKKFKDDYTNKLAGIYGADPNYRDPYRQDNRQLPANSFRSTNRMLIYNDIVKKHNEKIAKIQKKYQDQINKLNDNNADDLALKIKLKKELAKYNSVNQLNEDNFVTNFDNKSKKSELEEDGNSKKTNQPIVLQPIDDNDPNEKDLYNKILSPQQLMQKANRFLNQQSNGVQENLNKNTSSITNNIQPQTSNEVPPVYIKQQTGDDDFTNSNTIDNPDSIPQFKN